jgi:hypothetical protein
MDHDGNLSQKEFYINSFLVNLAQSGTPLPETLPPSLANLGNSSFLCIRLTSCAEIPPLNSAAPSALLTISTPTPQVAPTPGPVAPVGEAPVDPWVVTFDRFLSYKQTFDSISQFLPQGSVAPGM